MVKLLEIALWTLTLCLGMFVMSVVALVTWARWGRNGH